MKAVHMVLDVVILVVVLCVWMGARDARRTDSAEPRECIVYDSNDDTAPLRLEANDPIVVTLDPEHNEIIVMDPNITEIEWTVNGKKRHLKCYGDVLWLDGLVFQEGYDYRLCDGTIRDNEGRVWKHGTFVREAAE